MINTKKLPSFREHLKESLKNPEFRKAWKESEPEYILARQIIEKRLKKKMSQRELARKANTTQAVICRIESMNANPSIELLKKISQGLNSHLTIKI
ncbi:MAG: Transcriptional regulator, XRE family [Candidatus Shapirobacteria bacterium GW2011_GWE1_38_10]|uniref:Transcriptional regulator, XRE family n=1 Tax=Candidatus Shapirobacteria bacterium GW2011_GWE1_38_10 TaxID=1618488 RepID=A0A0G0I679_9BACT|nr:MAG: Transcriptional regulator, XRE family [Candidatus Shapirobacteria bacterium GW2011_GWF2_37_20]KKQ50062.1 MAG: Transcriptional regulator, XRE family [Candidatus Shapirobacteria bacterium GW2011_GWE1_38_10]KKQ64545.1 MAG: Transcriptional regulator, XRE family [Candidatus Shapirobacteria bacterium GW2011_GWF1_38_23]HBP51134.1 transcriptional regulator [Candidatus Shapirobacteria bacterium]